MAFGIIIKGKNQPDRNLRFKPHYNRSIVSKSNPNGTYIHDKKQYADELKKNNLVPYNPEGHKAEDKSYKPSKWCHDMVDEIQRTDGNPGGAYYEQLKKKGMTKEKLTKLREKAIKYTKNGKDGFSNE